MYTRGRPFEIMIKIIDFDYQNVRSTANIISEILFLHFMIFLSLQVVSDNKSTIYYAFHHLHKVGKTVD